VPVTPLPDATYDKLVSKCGEADRRLVFGLDDREFDRLDSKYRSNYNVWE
jgi:hypothetical protein